MYTATTDFMPPNQKPKISIVMVGRNDNYGGNLINRLNTSLKVLIELTNKYKTSFELVLVEYNPVLNKKFLYEELDIKNNQYLSVKVIIVPNKFHTQFENSNKIPLFEYLAKNIGIKRASADWVLGTNIDLIFSDELIQYLSSIELNPDTYYRANRHDISKDYFDENLSVETILEICKQKTYRILANHRTYYKSFGRWWWRFIHGRTLRSFLLCPLFNSLYSPAKKDGEALHENAAGDFTLVHKNMWEKARGYDQAPVGSALLDSYLLNVLYCYDIQQITLKEPLYHIYHQDGKGGRPLAAHQTFIENKAKMKATKIPYKINNPDWGFPGENFKEIFK